MPLKIFVGELADKEGRNVFALTMSCQWNALRLPHWLFMEIGGHVPPLLGSFAFHGTLSLSEFLKALG